MRGDRPGRLVPIRTWRAPKPGTMVAPPPAAKVPTDPNGCWAGVALMCATIAAIMLAFMLMGGLVGAAQALGWVR